MDPIRAKDKAIMCALVVAMFGANALLPAHALTTGLVAKYVIWATNSTLLLTMSAVDPGRPACATTGRYSVSLSTSQGQAVVAAILSAQAQGLQLIVSGTGQCALWPDSEDVSYISSVP